MKRQKGEVRTITRGHDQQVLIDVLTQGAAEPASSGQTNSVGRTAEVQLTGYCTGTTPTRPPQHLQELHLSKDEAKSSCTDQASTTSKVCFGLLCMHYGTLCMLHHCLSQSDKQRGDGSARQIITTTRSSSKQQLNYATERVVGNGSFGVVFQATCLETGETVRVDWLWRS